jgi:soluble lytic murein transglycosylase-like protein
MNKVITYVTSSPLLAVLLALATAFLNPAYAAGCQTMSSESLQSKASTYHPTIQRAASRYGVSTSLVKAVITVESCFRSKARGSLGEKGLMQLMPATARRFSIRNGYNAWQNIHGGTRYLGYLLQRYNGNLQRTVAAYNAGEGRIKPGGRIPNKAYVSKVMHAYQKFSGSKDTGISQPAPAVTSSKPVKAAFKPAAADVRVEAIPPSGSALPWPDLKPVSYTVKAGDTVYEAMRQTGVPVKKLIRLNRLAAPHHIQAGQVLRLSLIHI